MVGRRGEELRRVDLLFIKNLWRKSEGDEPFRVDGFVHSHELRRLADVIGKWRDGNVLKKLLKNVQPA